MGTERGTSKILCSDLLCKFRHNNRVGSKAQYECSLDLSDAVMVLKRFGYTTCEIGMGEALIGTEVLTRNFINRLKYNGRM